MTRSLSSTTPRVAAFRRRGRRAIEIDRRVRVRLQNRRRRHRRDVALEAHLNGLRLARIRHDAEDRARLQNLTDRHGDRLRRHLVNRREPALADLLPPARLVQLTTRYGRSVSKSAGGSLKAR